MKPAFCTHCHHKILRGKRKTFQFFLFQKLQKLSHSRAREDTRVDSSRSMTATEGTEEGFWPAYKLLRYCRAQTLVHPCQTKISSQCVHAIPKHCVAFSVLSSALLPTGAYVAAVFQVGCPHQDFWTQWSWFHTQKWQSSKKSYQTEWKLLGSLDYSVAQSCLDDLKCIQPTGRRAMAYSREQHRAGQKLLRKRSKKPPKPCGTHTWGLANLAF